MTNLLCKIITWIIYLLSEYLDYKYSRTYMRKYQSLMRDYNQLLLEVDACENMGRTLEVKVKTAEQKEAINAERLVILQSTRKHLPNVGLVAIAHIMLTEIDVALLNLDKTTGELIADAAASIARQWTLSTLAIG